MRLLSVTSLVRVIFIGHADILRITRDIANYVDQHKD